MKKERAPVAVGLVAPAPGTVEKQVKSITPERPRKLFELTLGGRAKMPAPSKLDLKTDDKTEETREAGLREAISATLRQAIKSSDKPESSNG